MENIVGFKNITLMTSTRNGGVSNGDFSSLNLAFHVGDELTHVSENRRLFFSKDNVLLNAKNSVFVRQFHSALTYKARFEDAGKGFQTFESGVEADALYTKEKGLALAIYHADCVPVFISVPSHAIVGIIHAGEEGSLNGITTKFIETLINDEGVNPVDVYAYIGPSLSFAHRLISKEKAEEIASRDNEYIKAVKATNPDYFLDLPLLNLLQLRKTGVPFANISFSDECTYENSKTYFSAQKSNITGRNISFIRREL